MIHHAEEYPLHQFPLCFGFYIVPDIVQNITHSHNKMNDKMPLGVTSDPGQILFQGC